MDDLHYGTRNKRGDWSPGETIVAGPLWTLPPSIKNTVNWVVAYIWPWNLLVVLITLVWWRYAIPDVRQLQTLQAGWILKLYGFNAVGIALFYGVVEWLYYVRRVQGTRFKYNGRFPADQPSAVFWFKSQNIDNFIRSFFIGVPIGTLLEAWLLWLFATGHAVQMSLSSSMGVMALLALFVAAPIVHEVHFYLIHRVIHCGVLYKWIHSVHHNSVNPSPWSSLSMHPVEAAAYFGVMLWVLVLPSHPALVVFLFNVAGFGAIVGHIGFDRFDLGSVSIKSSAYPHYLHHKYFEVNYSDNGFLPLDKWFGSWHDGSAEGDRLMQERLRRKSG